MPDTDFCSSTRRDSRNKEISMMNSNVAMLLIVAVMMSVGLSTITAQTFQYSRGWTNGKRNGNEINLLERLMTNPCQMEKLRYVLSGKPLNEKLMVPCDLLSLSPSEADVEASGLRLKRSAYEARDFDAHL